ncbi:hypothetical protein GN956_G20694 [Arapaima gigas]
MQRTNSSTAWGNTASSCCWARTQSHWLEVNAEWLQRQDGMASLCKFSCRTTPLVAELEILCKIKTFQLRRWLLGLSRHYKSCHSCFIPNGFFKFA